ncbi:DUF4340 domain-containing protein [Amphibacillus cookii]|uniref:DUF4340 domain-containing protein n=1 Tax=Amphibacillus cookii TaxID=767787 RepID=UPI001959969F|nr:DUF4340 domain-containing protein [Amphibacillus cookii]MBM7541595.1 hypothetical protein [Amphibacillus cookii]
MKKSTRLKLMITIVALTFLFIFLFNDDARSSQIINGEDIVTSFIVQGEQGFEIEWINQKWIVQGRLEETNQDQVNKAIDRLANWIGEEVDLKRRETGLNTPQLSIRLNYQNGEDHRLMIGSLNQDESGYYVEDRQREAIYIVERSLIEAVPFYADAFLDTSIFSWEATEVEQVFIDNGTETIHLTKNSPYPEEETRANITGWFVEAPYQLHHHARYSRIEALLESIHALAMDQLVAEQVSDFSPYGLDDSDFTIDFVRDAGTSRLMIGEPATPESYYAKRDQVDQVFTISKDILDAFSHPAQAYHDGYVKILALDLISELTITSADHNIQITIDHLDQEALRFEADGNQVDEKLIREAYKALAGLTVAGIVDDPSYQEPEVVVQSTLLTSRGEKNIYLEFVDYDIDHYTAFIDRTSDFLVKKEDVNTMLNTMKDIIQ